MTTAYFSIARRNHQWVILGTVRLSDDDALKMFEQEFSDKRKEKLRIRPCAWGIKKSLATL